MTTIYCKFNTKFCYVCGRYLFHPNDKETLSENTREIYNRCFNIPVQTNVPFVPTHSCKRCAWCLRGGVTKSVQLFKTPMIWHQPEQHDAGECYFCVNKPSRGSNRSSKKLIKYKATKFATCPTTDKDDFGNGHPPVLLNREPGKESILFTSFYLCFIKIMCFLDNEIEIENALSSNDAVAAGPSSAPNIQRFRALHEHNRMSSNSTVTTNPLGSGNKLIFNLIYSIHFRCFTFRIFVFRICALTKSIRANTIYES